MNENLFNSNYEGVIKAFNESESLLESLEAFLKQRDKYSFEQYESEFKKFNESKAMYDALSSGDFWSEITLILPFPIGISEQSLDLIVSDYEVKIRTEQFSSGLELMEADNGVVQLSFDKYGLLTRTTVTLKIKKYLSLKNEKLYFFGDKETRSIALILVCSPKVRVKNLTFEVFLMTKSIKYNETFRMVAVNVYLKGKES